jgi:polar amino acid transport system permease protein
LAVLLAVFVRAEFGLSARPLADRIPQRRVSTFRHGAGAGGSIGTDIDWNLGFIVIAGNVQAAILALSLNEGAYMAEIIRAGIASVDHGQAEAASSLGMTRGLLMRRIILPQALRLIIPPLGNQFNVMLKNTTLVSIIGVSELLLITETINSATFRTFELYTVVGLYFLTLTTLWGFVQRRIELRFAAPSRDGAVALRPWRFVLRNVTNAVSR